MIQKQGNYEETERTIKMTEHKNPKKNEAPPPPPPKPPITRLVRESYGNDPKNRKNKDEQKGEI